MKDIPITLDKLFEFLKTINPKNAAIVLDGKEVVLYNDEDKAVTTADGLMTIFDKDSRIKNIKIHAFARPRFQYGNPVAFMDEIYFDKIILEDSVNGTLVFTFYSKVSYMLPDGVKF